MTATWRKALLEQLEFYWGVHLWPRLEGLTDEEYLWEPAPGRSWSLRRDADGVVRLEQFSPEPPIPPVTTIAWRMVHVARDIFGKRARALFGPTVAPDGADMYDDRHWPEPLPMTAADGLATLERAYTHWHDSIAALDDDALQRPIGPKGEAFADDSLAALVLHLNRETMAHGAEICLLRDLYRAERDQEDPIVSSSLRGDVEALVAALAADGDAVARLRGQRPELVAEAAGLRRWPVVRALVEAGFDPSAGSPAALHYAAAAGERDESRFLLDQGADPSALDARFGFPPAGWADHFGHGEVAALLRSAGDDSEG